MNNTRKNMFCYTFLALSILLNISLSLLLLNKSSTNPSPQISRFSTLSENNTQHDSNIQMPSKTIKNPLLVLIGCVKYNDSNADLPDTGVELDKLKKLFTEVYKYKHFITTYDKNNPDTWYLTRKNIAKTCKQARDKAVELAKQGKIDGVFVIYSGHGQHDSILASDGRAYPEAKAYNLFGGDEAPELVDIPKIFMWIKCNGPSWPMPVKKNDTLYHPDANRFIIHCNTDTYKVDNYAKIADEFADWATNAPLLHKRLDLLSFFSILSNNVQYSSKHKEILEQQITASHNYFLVPNDDT